MLKQLLSIYSPKFPSTLVYMLQSCEYRPGPYFKWLWRTKDFSKVANRRQLDKTAYAKMLLAGLGAGIAVELLAGLGLVIYGVIASQIWLSYYGGALIVIYPLLWAHLVIVPLELGRLYIVEPRSQRQVDAAKPLFLNHPGAKIAVAGSYGKTTMKEVLSVVLSEGLQVAATKANFNVLIEHAKFARSLSGKEDALIIEYGEGAPGDIAKFCDLTQPTYGVITGLAPAHLDRYKTLRAAGEDIFFLADFLHHNNVYVNKESQASESFIKPGDQVYGNNAAAGWKAKDIHVDLDGVTFNLTKGKKTISLKSQLLGRHQVGVLSVAAVIGMNLGLSQKQVQAGVAKTKPFAHRMQPYNLGGAWIIDDTYNGNIEGIKAGTELLGELKAEKRKIYVTPGLVEQGKESARVHKLMGNYIALAKPDVVVLMHNSTTEHIKQGLSGAGYAKQLIIEDDPLKFYANLEQFVAKGDIVLMQNDWPDNYA